MHCRNREIRQEKQDPSEEYQSTISLDMSSWITISDTTETNASEIRSNDHFNATPWITISINTTEANASPLLCRHVII